MTTPDHFEHDGPEGSVLITPAQMYHELRATHDEVKRLSQALDPAIKNLRHAVDTVAERVGDHETRLRVLERRIWIASGFAALAAAALGALAQTVSFG